MQRLSKVVSFRRVLSDSTHTHSAVDSGAYLPLPAQRTDTRSGNRSRVEQDGRSGLAFEVGIDGIAEPLVDGTFLESTGF